MAEALGYVKRGQVVEAVHYGDIAVVDHKGNIIFSRGDPNILTYFRSAAKPLQAAAALIKGVDTKFGLDDEEIAMLCSSHSGEDIHVRNAKRIASKIGIEEYELKCGTDYPMNSKAMEKIIRNGLQKSAFYHGCCCKHMAMIAESRIMGEDAGDYYKASHPVQRWITEVIGNFANLSPKNILLGIDGCGVPVHAMPLKNMACAFEKLATADFADDTYVNSCRKITASMMKYPYLIAGEGRFDYQLMEALKDIVIAKTGAEGVFCIGVSGEGIGIAIKIHDGDQRSMEGIITRLLDILGFIPEGISSNLDNYRELVIHNFRDETVGKIYAAF